MNLWTQNANTTWIAAELARQSAYQPTPAAMYMMLEMYYNNNGLYDAIQQELYAQAIWTPGMKGLRNPAHRIVEFYPSKIWPGTLPDALPILTDNPEIVEPIQQGWTWSNFGAKKQLAARWFSMFGDWFVKVPTHSDSNGVVDRVYQQQIKPEYVTDFDEDERGFINYIRIDIPMSERDEAGQTVVYTHTEVWDKAAGTYRTWKNEQGASASVDQLGTPAVSREIAEFGIDFVPFVHAMFQDVGDKRGVGAFVHSLDKIDEVNRQATRLHQLIFRYNKATLVASANDKDAQGRPLPAPKIGDSAGKLALGDDDILLMPGMSKLDSMVPPINYEAHLKAIDAQLGELETDQPELLYYRLKEIGSGDISGRALRTLLSAANDKVLEARGNMETALIRADQMMLTIGVNAGLFPANIGKYENGDFDHRFANRDVFPLSDIDVAEVVKADVDAGIPLVTSLRKRGWSEADIKEMEKDKAKEKKANAASLGQALLNAQRNFDAGGQSLDDPATGNPAAGNAARDVNSTVGNGIVDEAENHA
jgi:hypothetical protein